MTEKKIIQGGKILGNILFTVVTLFFLYVFHNQLNTYEATQNILGVVFPVVAWIIMFFVWRFEREFLEAEDRKRKIEAKKKN